MGKTTKKANEKDFKTRLLSLQRDIGCDVVVTLLITKRGDVDFISCYNSKRYFEEIEPDDESPRKDLQKEPDKSDRMHGHSFNMKNYIG